jgi:uncharacterized membrane protein
MSFANPAWLLLLGAIPALWWFSRQRFARRHRRDLASVALRSVIVLLLALALAGAQISQRVDRLAVIFLADQSDSMSNEALAEGSAFIRDAVASKPPDDLWTTVAFGADARPDGELTTSSDVRQLRSSVDGTQTNIANALNVAIGMFPADAAQRIVLLSDGQETLGDARSRAQLAAAAGIQVGYQGQPGPAGADARISDLRVPASMTAGQEFDIDVTIEADAPAQGTLRLYAGRDLIHEAPVDLRSGTNRFTVAQTSTRTGFIDFSAQLELAGTGDRFSQNNRLAAFSQVTGPPQVLVIASADEATADLVPALTAAGYDIATSRPWNLAPDLTALAPYRSIIIANVPARDFTDTQMRLLDSYTRDLGGGLVVIGGDQSYGPGGYFDTPLEATMPVETQIRDEVRLPQLTIAYLVDRSGSMAATGPSGVPNLELAKEAILRSLRLLGPADRAAVATFDSGGTWVAEFQALADAEPLMRAVGALRPAGGTDIRAGLELVAEAIRREPAERRHLILMTDGGSNPTGLVDLVRELNEAHGVTLSVIAIGDSVPAFLREMAAAGGGNYHEIINTLEIPTVLTQETVLATRSYIIEETLVPARADASPILDGITALPALDGYVATTPKTTAEIVLSSGAPFEDPILAVWRAGLGRAAAFTSDASARWAAEWVGTPAYTRFWSQLIDWSITEGASRNLETRIALNEGLATITVDARDDDGGYLNTLQLEAVILQPDGQTARTPLQQTAPGLYSASFTPRTEGAYFVTIRGEGGTGDEAQAYSDVNGWVLSYSPEYTSAGADEGLLREIARLTGGRAYAGDAAAVFAHDVAPRIAIAPLWPWLLVLALLLWPADIALRRLMVTRADLRALRQALLGRGAAGGTAREAQIAALMGARERARSRTGQGQETGPPGPGAGPAPAPSPGAAAPPNPSAAPGNIGAELLRRRGRRDAESVDRDGSPER